MNRLNVFLRKIYNFYNQTRLKNRSFSLIASNCNGSLILHDLNLPFNSPFVNLWLKPKDFLKLCENMEYYMGCQLKFVNDEHTAYPIAMLDDIKIYFQHFKSEKDARTKWEIRKKRIDYHNIFILFTDRDGCTYEDLQRFDKLKFAKKAVLVHKNYPEIKSSVYIPGFEKEDCVGMCMYFKNKITYKKYYDSFDYVNWFNK